jgi:hypothetical protein
MKTPKYITKKALECALEWCDSSARLTVSDCSDAYRETEYLSSRFYALTGDKLDIEAFVKKYFKKEYLDALHSNWTTYDEDREDGDSFYAACQEGWCAGDALVKAPKNYKPSN